MKLEPKHFKCRACVGWNQASYLQVLQGPEKKIPCTICGLLLILISTILFLYQPTCTSSTFWNCMRTTQQAPFLSSFTGILGNEYRQTKGRVFRQQKHPNPVAYCVLCKRHSIYSMCLLYTVHLYGIPFLLPNFHIIRTISGCNLCPSTSRLWRGI